MLKISMTYEIVTPESAENGESAESGFVFDSAECTAHDLADYIKKDGFVVPSQSHGVPRWLSTPGEDVDPFTGEVETRSIHPGKDAQSQKVWEKVLHICGIV